MADNVITPIADGVRLAADDVGGTLYPRTKVSFGQDGSATDVTVASPLPVSAVLSAVGTTRGATVGLSASTLMAANALRRGFVIQNQSQTADVYFNPNGAASVGPTSILIGPGGYYESSPHRVSPAAIGIIATEAGVPVYAEEW